MEGPSLHFLEKELQIFHSKKISNAYGNAKFDKEKLIGQKINDIYAFGKRLFIQLEEYVVITHFLMYGSYRIDEERADRVPRLALITPYHALFFYSCSVKCEKLHNIKEKLPLDYDILSPNWNIKKIVAAIKNNPKETVDDILFDQEIFPGVGNIIKNEALALSYLNPQKKVAQLSLKKITELAQNTRIFSQTFLNLYDNWPLLKKQMLVYGRSTCARCGSKIIRVNSGKRNRRSFFCTKCQKK